jgi:hypothetical protein
MIWRPACAPAACAPRSTPTDSSVTGQRPSALPHGCDGGPDFWIVAEGARRPDFCSWLSPIRSSTRRPAGRASTQACGFVVGGAMPAAVASRRRLDSAAALSYETLCNSVFV